MEKQTKGQPTHTYTSPIRKLSGLGFSMNTRLLSISRTHLKYYKKIPAQFASGEMRNSEPSAFYRPKGSVGWSGVEVRRVDVSDKLKRRKLHQDTCFKVVYPRGNNEQKKCRDKNKEEMKIWYFMASSASECEIWVKRIHNLIAQHGRSIIHTVNASPGGKTVIHSPTYSPQISPPRSQSPPQLSPRSQSPPQLSPRGTLHIAYPKPLSLTQTFPRKSDKLSPVSYEAGFWSGNESSEEMDLIRTLEVKTIALAKMKKDITIC